MIAILSKSKFEKTTDDVIDWLIHFNQPFKRINGDKLNSLDYVGYNFNVIWYWRWIDPFSIYSKNLDSVNEIDVRLRILKNIESEKKVISEYLFNSFRNCFWLSHPLKSNINKLITLKTGEEIGLKTPKTKLINKKKDLIDFKRKYNRIITKSVSNPFPIFNKNTHVPFYTREVTDGDIKIIPKDFPVSFCQELIEKSFEIRVFFLCNKFYSMAKFNKEVDGRFKQNKARKVPFILPKNIESKLRLLLKRLEYNFASIDLLSDDENFYFLEINPVGQFGGLSRICNYYLEREIALILKNENEKRNRRNKKRSAIGV